LKANSAANELFIWIYLRPSKTNDPDQQKQQQMLTRKKKKKRGGKTHTGKAPSQVKVA